ncbi:hypothetical protein KUCAC02_023504 [Chaenocephalus aceratus]|uniref:Uncharacterized protein n=1 Tax=Chaenocephalus aceratus TaxID=36190 RepID=A0ACB9XS95_CHAAC|nr:hypothetical protein KUCAC02_023504 [Chaenocephalus aceratus]
MAIYKCNLTCRDLAHFHCPQCAKTINDASIRDAICIPVWKPGHFLLAGFPRQLYGNDCGIFMLMYALYTILDAPYDFTITDMPALRKWWCKEEQLQPHPADVSVGKDVDKTMEAPTSKIVQDCKKAAEWVHKHLCTRVHLPDATCGPS